MIDAFHFSPLPNEIWIPGWVSVVGGQYRQITIPKNANMLWFTAISGGGGGARPNVAAATAGGGGGGTGNVMHLIIPASAIPKVLWAHVGLGGLGATANNTGGASGIGTFLSCLPNANDEDVLMVVNGGNGGAAVGTGGTSGTATAIASMDIATHGIWKSFSGQTGGAGTTGNGADIIPQTFISAGAGGGGSSNGTGGRHNTQSPLYPVINGGAVGDNPGGDGIMLRRPLLCIGGAGGGGINGAGTGANRGGNGGGYGSGGGGGGNAASGVSGNGGDGAPGLLIMRWW